MVLSPSPEACSCVQAHTHTYTLARTSQMHTCAQNCTCLPACCTQALAYTRTFRLNEGLTSALTSASNLASLPLLCLFGAAIWASRLFAAAGTVPAIPLPPAPPSVLPLLVFCVVSAAVLGACAAHAKRADAQGEAPRRLAAAGPGAGVCERMRVCVHALLCLSMSIRLPGCQRHPGDGWCPHL